MDATVKMPNHSKCTYHLLPLDCSQIVLCLMSWSVEVDLPIGTLVMCLLLCNSTQRRYINPDKNAMTLYMMPEWSGI